VVTPIFCNFRSASRRHLLRCIIFSGRMAELGHERRINANAPAAGRPQTPDPAGGQGGFRLGPGLASRAAKQPRSAWPSPKIVPAHLAARKSPPHSRPSRRGSSAGTPAARQDRARAGRDGVHPRRLQERQRSQDDRHGSPPVRYPFSTRPQKPDRCRFLTHRRAFARLMREWLSGNSPEAQAGSEPLLGGPRVCTVCSEQRCCQPSRGESA
jgi:hypothetical protein